ncbi:MAG TPA: formate dehydrogenase beta subunit [Rhizobiales bacterium]|nr:formate dehydrogenase beta subunit [Hyphomicrobiales bacterium]
MSTRLFLPRESVALALGADDVAKALLAGAKMRGEEIELVRTGSRGAFWAEPLLEVEKDEERILYRNFSVADVQPLFEAGLSGGNTHPKYLGSPADIPWLARQTRRIFARCGLIDPLSLTEYQDHGGFAGLNRALSMKAEDILQALSDSGLRGRGGAGFPAAIKWRTVAEAKAAQKYIICNADEGDSGTFADRLILESDPFLLIESMLIAGLATGASKGVIYLRSEYPLAAQILTSTLKKARKSGWLGQSLRDTGFAFDIELFIAAGSYVCGEETALLESLEGKRGLVRSKPPLPAHEGLYGSPTLINNVLTLCAVPNILTHGARAFHELGTGTSRGTCAFQLGGNIRHGGVIEAPFGISLRELVEDYGGGTRTGKALRAVQVGGPLGAYLPAGQLDLPMDYETLGAAGAALGHGGIVVFDESVNMLDQAIYAFAFCARESCGKCTPCRIGSVRGAEVLNRLKNGGEKEANLQLIEDLCEIMADGSACAMGGLTPLPVRSALRHFARDFQSPATGESR